MHVSDWGGSSDGEAEEGGSSRRVIVCSTDLGALQCFSLSLADSYSYMDTDSGEATEEGFCEDISFANGQAILTRCPEFRGEAEPFIQGQHDVRILLQRGDLRWPDVWQPLATAGS